jgi:hypothetical protein
MEHMQMTSASKADILSGNKVKTMYLEPSLFFEVQSTFKTIEIIPVETKKVTATINNKTSCWF